MLTRRHEAYLNDLPDAGPGGSGKLNLFGPQSRFPAVGIVGHGKYHEISAFKSIHDQCRDDLPIPSYTLQPFPFKLDLFGFAYHFPIIRCHSDLVTAEVFSAKAEIDNLRLLDEQVQQKNLNYGAVGLIWKDKWSF